MSCTTPGVTAAARDDVLAALAPAASFVEQPERLADAGGVAEKDLQLPAVLCALRCFDLPEQRLAGPRAILRRHVTRRLLLLTRRKLLRPARGSAPAR